jgi:hypothetical protein
MANEQLRSARSLMETADLDTMQAGGPSSSTLLNEQQASLLTDLVELDRRTSETETELDLATLLFTHQNSALAALLTSLESQLPATSETWLADFYTDSYVDASTTAEHSVEYGQVTLPILRTQENLVGFDSREQIWVPKTTRIAYATSDETPEEQEWLFDDRAVYALDGRKDTTWWRARPTTEVVWVRVQVPANLNASRLSNCIILHAFPSFGAALLSLEYRDPAGNWTAADLSYLPGWDETQVQNIANLRLWLPPTQITEFRLKLDLSGTQADLWGFSNIQLQWVEFQPSATLVVDYSQHSPPTLETITVLGKDQDALEYLTQNLVGPQVSIGLTQVSQGTTPVITGVQVEAA